MWICLLQGSLKTNVTTYTHVKDRKLQILLNMVQMFVYFHYIYLKQEIFVCASEIHLEPY